MALLSPTEKAILDESCEYVLSMDISGYWTATNITGMFIQPANIIFKRMGTLLTDKKEFYRLLTVLAKKGFIKAEYEMGADDEGYNNGLSFFSLTNAGFGQYVDEHEPNISSQVSDIVKSGMTGKEIGNLLGKNFLIVNYALDQLQDNGFVRHADYEIY
jgi:hypothetical protein